MNAVEYALQVQGWMSECELSWIAKSASSLAPGAVWLEVGTWMGRSWAAAALGLREGSTIISVDTFMGEHGEPLAYVQDHGPVLPDFVRIHETVRKMRPDLQSQILVMPSPAAARYIHDAFCDVVFIDGHHSTEAVASDLRAWMPKLRRGGTMCGHDGNDLNVQAALRDLPARFDPSERGSIWTLDQVELHTHSRMFA